MKIIEWLKSLFIHPKEESTEMSEPLNDASTATGTTVQQAETALPTAAQPVAPVAQADDVQTKSPAAAAIDNFLSSKGVNDFEAALAFVESGVAQLGTAAKDELKALAVKYL